MSTEEILINNSYIWTQSDRHPKFLSILYYTILYYTMKRFCDRNPQKLTRNPPLFLHFFLWKPFNSTVSASETHQKHNRNPSEIQLTSRKSCESVRWNQLTAQSMSKSNPMTTKWSLKFQSISVVKYRLNSSTAWFQTILRQRQSSEYGMRWKEHSWRIRQILAYNPFIYEKPYIPTWKR